MQKLKVLDVMDFRHKIFIDGGLYNNQICLIDKKHDIEIIETVPDKPKLNASIIEFEALAKALDYVKDFSDEEIYIFTDSKEVMKYGRTMNGNAWLMGTSPIASVKNKCHERLNQLKLHRIKVKIRWVNRGTNPAGRKLECLKNNHKQNLR